MQVAARARGVGPDGLLDQPPEVAAPGVVGGGEALAQTGAGHGLAGLPDAVGHVPGGQAEEDRGAALGLLVHDAVPEQALGAGGQCPERGEQRRDGTRGARRVQHQQQAGVDAAGALVAGPGGGDACGQQQQVQPQRDARVGAAGRLAGREGEGLRRELAGGRVAGRAPAGVGEDRGPVPGAQFPEGRVGGRGVGAQQSGEPFVRSVRVRSVARVPGLDVVVGHTGPSHPRASSPPYRCRVRGDLAGAAAWAYRPVCG
ncbi:hypothetical protein [Streptomyces tropicalis]|uniref:hypothetical protein n=1 Tax=Streptomyces tropicalis TaxID=3034234 RepID=UPI003F689BC7